VRLSYSRVVEERGLVTQYVIRNKFIGVGAKVLTMAVEDLLKGK